MKCKTSRDALGNRRDVILDDPAEAALRAFLPIALDYHRDVCNGDAPLPGPASAPNAGNTIRDELRSLFYQYRAGRRLARRILEDVTVQALWPRDALEALLRKQPRGHLATAIREISRMQWVFRRATEIAYYQGIGSPDPYHERFLPDLLDRPRIRASRGRYLAPENASRPALIRFCLERFTEEGG